MSGGQPPPQPPDGLETKYIRFFMFKLTNVPARSFRIETINMNTAEPNPKITFI